MICTVSTVKDSLANVTHFVECNLAAGVDHLFVFLEGGDPDVLAYLEEHPHATVVDSDEANRRNPQPGNLNTRQTINANRINVLLADVASAQWLFHIDGDECLDIDKERLLAIDADVATVRLLPKEAVSSSREGDSRYFKRLLTREELSLLTVLGLIDKPSNRSYFHGHVSGKIGIRPSLSFGMHIHQARVLGEDETTTDFEADWLHLLHYESFTMDEFLRKWVAHLSAGEGAKFRGEKELVRGAVSAVLDNPHLDEDEKREYLTEIYRRRIEEDVPTLLKLGLLDTIEPGNYRPSSFTRREEKQLAREMPALLAADHEHFLPRRIDHDLVELKRRIHGGPLRRLHRTPGVAARG